MKENGFILKTVSSNQYLTDNITDAHDEDDRVFLANIPVQVEFRLA